MKFTRLIGTIANSFVPLISHHALQKIVSSTLCDYSHWLYNKNECTLMVGSILKLFL